MKKEIIELEGSNYLQNYVKQLPSHCLLNKGITGCGGTTVELQSTRNRIILCPTKNLVECKANLGYFKVDGSVKESQVLNYVNSTTGYKKIIATYDALPKLMKLTDYFLLIDEYHLLFNDYSFRNDAIVYILQNFRKFDNWCFMTATPLKDEFILNELKDIDQITFKWPNTRLANVQIIDTFYTTKKLLELIDKHPDKNLHIFLNSVRTINTISQKLDKDNYRVVCSNKAKNKVTNYAEITDPIKKLNFYTSCAFEGCDIYDENGLCIIISDTKIATTILDISTKVRQVCGRLRDSKYKDQVIVILNTSLHRYAGISKSEFIKRVNKYEIEGKANAEAFKNGTEEYKSGQLRVFKLENQKDIYVNKINNEIVYDPNLKAMDLYNYNLISEIYNNQINVLMEYQQLTDNVEMSVDNQKGLEWIKQVLEDREYTYQELEALFEPLFTEHCMKWNKNTSLKLYFPDYISKRKTKNGKKDTYYKFNNF